MYKLSKSDIVSFLMNFLAVVLGIVLTLGGESLMSHKRERKDLNNSLDLVKSELQDNLDYLHYCDTLFQQEVEAAEFLIRFEDDYSKAPEDTLWMVANIPLTTNTISLYTDAFELLKSSGVLTQIKDKKLALTIFKTYDILANDASFINQFYEHKLKYLEPAMNKNVKDILAGDNVTALRLWSEMTNSKEGRQYLREIIRFLSIYDPSEIYEATELTIDGIKEYCR